MDRRRFIVTAVSATAVGTALATDACSLRGGLNGLLPSRETGAALLANRNYTLNVVYAITNIKGYKLRGRTYNGKTVGPMMVIRPGDTLNVKVVNKLPPNPVASPQHGSVPIPLVHDSMEAMNPKLHGPFTQSSSNVDPMNNPHNFNTTNLHTHGLQTIPHLFEPLGTSNPAAELITIEPGKSYNYSLPIPKDHPSGLHWYHPHNHGSTDVQVSNGMAGLIVVRGPIDEVPEIKAAREIFMVFQTLDVNPSKTRKGIYEREYIAYRAPQNGGYDFGTQYTMITTNGEGVAWLDNNAKTVKKLGVPSFNVQPGEVVRLRILNGTNYEPLMLALPEFVVWQIAFDGVNTLTTGKPKDMSGKGVTEITPANLFTAPVRVIHAANRVELLIQAPSTPGTYTLSSLASKGISFDAVPKLDLANFVVGGKAVSMKIPTTLPTPTREYPVIEKKDIVQYRKFVFNQGKRTDLLMGFGFTINDQLYQMEECPTAPKVGTCEEWRMENATNEAHPFHLHENSFQLVEINDQPNSPMEVWDTFLIPPKVGNTNGSLTIRIRFVQWYGKTVFHCHILPHEDTGMMQNILMV